jgi:hypothetical protein
VHDGLEILDMDRGGFRFLGWTKTKNEVGQG